MTTNSTRFVPHQQPSRPVLSASMTMNQLLCLGMLGAALITPHALASNGAQPSGASQSSVAQQASAPPSASAAPSVYAHGADTTNRTSRANFSNESASTDARQTADWVLASGDNAGMSFVIVDKVDAKVFVFDAHGELLGTGPALLGLAKGDDSVPGIGDRKLSSILPEERTTPAGRFVAVLDRNLHGKEILWVDYDTAISLHPVLTSNVKERRGQRLSTPTPLDNRISYGCINVPAAFFKNVVHPAFRGTVGIVYVLPEIRTAQQVFASYDVDARANLRCGADSSGSSPRPNRGGMVGLAHQTRFNDLPSCL